jgi:hypothetical protein
MMQQPYYNTMYPQPSLYPTKTIDTNNNILWVDGEVGAKAYPLYGINNGVILMDREEEDVIYIKTTDSQGRPSTQRYKLIPEQKQEMQPLKLEEYVRKDELQDMLKQILQPAQEGVTKDEQTIPTTQSTTIVKRTVI